MTWRWRMFDRMRTNSVRTNRLGKISETLSALQNFLERSLR